MKGSTTNHETVSHPMNQVLGVVLGGGKGTRLYPLTKDRSKPAVPFGGNYRLIDIPISNCINSGINKVFVMTQFNSASLNRHVTQTYKFDIFHNGFVDILATEQTIDPSASFTQGTADAVRRALKHFSSYRSSGQARYVLILSGDQLYRMDFRKIIAKHIESKAQISVAVIPVPDEDVSRCGIVKIDDECKVERFLEKPKDFDVIRGWNIPKKHQSCKFEDRKFLGSMGIYVFDIDTLYDILLTHPEMMDFGKEVIPYSIENKYQVFGYVFDDYWEDIGTIKSFHAANIELTKPHGAFNLYETGSPFFSHPRFLPPSKLSSVKLENCIISDGVFAEDAELKDSVIGVRSIIRKGAKIENTVIIGADYYEEESFQDVSPNTPRIGIGEGTEIKNAILDKNCRIGKNCRIVNESGVVNREEEDYSIVDGIVVVTKGAVIPDGTVI